MAKNQKNRKAMSGRSKSAVALALLLAVTLVVSYIGIAGLTLGPEQSRKLLPFMPMNAEMEAYILPTAMQDGTLYEVVLAAAAEGEEDPVAAAAAVYEARLAHYGVRGAKVEKVSDTQLNVTVPSYTGTDMIGTMLSSGGSFSFTDSEGNELLTNADFTSTKLLYANGYYYVEMKGDKAAIKAATEATMGDVLNINLDGSLLVSPTVDEVNTKGVFTLGFGLTEEATRALAAMLVNEPVTGTIVNVIAKEAPAASTASLSALLIALWVMFAVAVVLMVVRYRAAGVAAAWTLWVYMLLFFFLMCTVTLVYVDYAVWACVFAGVVISVAVLSEQLKAAAKAVKEGRDAAAALRYGMNATAKKNLVLHAAVLVVALLLMVLSFTRPYGYTLATVVVASVVANMVAVRALVPVVVSALGGKTCLISGK